MKKYLTIFLLFMIMPLVINAETCDPDKITIDSITIESKTDNVNELEEASANGNKINLNLSMSEVGDNIKYKIVVKNDSNEDYAIDKNSFNISSNYIEYSLEFDDESNLVKANSSAVVYLKVNYANEVSNEVFEAGTYNDNKSMIVYLSNDLENNIDTIENPKTGVKPYFVILLIILLISESFYYILKKKKSTEFMFLIIAFTSLVPTLVLAVCKSQSE